MAYLSGYSKYKVLTLTGGASGAQTAFQLKITVSKEAAMQGDFDDLRFTQADGTTLVDAWAEVIVTDTSATVWVEFPTTPANTVEQIYRMYYGNAGAASDWDGDATFPDFFEDFDSVADWDYDSNYAASSYSFTATDGIGDVMVNAANTSHVVRYKKTCGFNTTNMHMLLRFKGDANTWIYMTSSGTERWRAAWYSSPSSYTVYDEAWDINGAITIVKVHTKGTVSGTQHNFFDFIAFRKYAANPPTYAFGAEQSVPSGNPYWYYNLLKRRN